MRIVFAAILNNLKHPIIFLKRVWLNDKTDLILFVSLLTLGELVLLFGHIDASSLFSIDEILLAILLPLVFFLVSPGASDPITPFDKKVIFEKIINSRRIFWIIILLIVPPLLWGKLQGNILAFIFLIYVLGIFAVLEMFLRSYRWIASSSIAKQSFRNRMRLDFLRTSMTRDKVDPGELWQDFFNQRNFVERYNNSDDHPFKLTFILDYDFTKELFDTIKSLRSNPLYNRQNDYTINNLLHLMNDNLGSVMQNTINLGQINDFYFFVLENYSSIGGNGFLSLDSDFMWLRGVFSNYIKLVFSSDDSDNMNKFSFFDTIQTHFNQLIDTKQQANTKEQDKAINLFESFVRNNASTIFDAYDGTGDFSFPTEWMMDESVLNKSDTSSLSFAEKSHQTIKYAWFRSYTRWIFNTNLFVSYDPNVPLSFSDNKQQKISEAVLGYFDLKLWSDLLMLLKFVIRSYPGTATDEEFQDAFEELFNKSKTFGDFPQLLQTIDALSRDERSLTYDLVISEFPELKDTESLRRILEFLRSENTIKKYQNDRRKLGLIAKYSYEIQELIDKKQ
ncbi:hypothetical protein [Oenococcus sicerae]|uniref:hypothetical protein n=1 Tax=Oenococcus sicerae TaxID=2203724 RepID=UPI0010BB3749|nr:hypothetical protein OAL24_00338 [Oenococcus sicerae]